MEEKPIFVNGNPINKVSVKKENSIKDIPIKKKKIISADTNLELSFMAGSNNDHFLMIDNQNRKYKKCAYCKHWYLLSNFNTTNRKNSIGGVGVFCNKCANRKNTSEKKNDKEEQLNTEELIGKPISDILSYLTDNQLLSEIKKRGYIGELVLTKKIKL